MSRGFVATPGFHGASEADGSGLAALATTAALPVRPVPIRVRSIAGSVDTVMIKPESLGARSTRCWPVIVNAMRTAGVSVEPAWRTRIDCTAPNDRCSSRPGPLSVVFWKSTYQRSSERRCHSYEAAPLSVTRTAIASPAAGSIARSVTVARPATIGGAAVGVTFGTAPGCVSAGGGGGGGALTATPCVSKITAYRSGEPAATTRCVAPRVPAIVSVVTGTFAVPPTATSIASTAVPGARRDGGSEEPNPANESCTRSGASAFVVVTNGIAACTVTVVRPPSLRTSSAPTRGCNTVSPASATGSTYSARASAKNGSTTSLPSANGANGACARTPPMVYAGSPSVNTTVRRSAGAMTT